MSAVKIVEMYLNSKNRVVLVFDFRTDDQEGVISQSDERFFFCCLFFKRLCALRLQASFICLESVVMEASRPVPTPTTRRCGICGFLQMEGPSVHCAHQGRVKNAGSLCSLYGLSAQVLPLPEGKGRRKGRKKEEEEENFLTLLIYHI